MSVADTAPLRIAEAVKVQKQLDGKKDEYERLQKLLMSLYENLTDGIIDKTEYKRLKEDFEAVQQVLAQRPGTPYMPHNSGPLQRKVFCGVCGHAMRRCPKPRPHYRCVTHSYTDTYTCTGHGVDEADILDAVLESIRLYARLVVRLNEINAARQERSKQEKKGISKQLISLQNEKLRLESRLQELYECFVGGEISREKYLIQKGSITDREQEIAVETARLEKSMADSSPKQFEAIAKYINYAEIDGLTAEMLHDLVKRVNIYPGDVLEVQLNFADKLEELQAQLNIVA